MITVKESCVEVIMDLLAKSVHTSSCALRQFGLEYKSLESYPLCDCGHSDGVEAAWDLIQILTGDGE